MLWIGLTAQLLPIIAIIVVAIGMSRRRVRNNA